MRVECEREEWPCCICDDVEECRKCEFPLCTVTRMENE
jgi:hypothetical protein